MQGTNETFLPWKREPLLEWANLTPPSWASQTIRSLDEALEPVAGLFALWFRVRTRRAIRSVDLRCLVGQRGRYAGATWLQALNAPPSEAPELQGCLYRADATPSHYLSAEPQPDVLLVSLDGRHWYAENGTYITLVAKFFHALYAAANGSHPLMHEVPTVAHTVDEQTLNAYLAMLAMIERHRLPIVMDVRAGQLLTDIHDEQHFEQPSVMVTDSRMRGQGYGDSRLLRAPEFRAYSDWVCRAHGQITRFERARHSIGRFFNPETFDTFSLTGRH